MDEETEHEIVMDALQDVLIDVDVYARDHFGAEPLRQNTIAKVRVALRLLEKQ